MFSRSAALYDFFYSRLKDYPAEAHQIATLLREVHPHAVTILDVACGTGEHARLLAESYGYRVDGVDIDPEFVRIAQAKLSNGTVYRADMTALLLGRWYDVVLCLFSSIGYVRTLEDLRRTLVCFREHLTEGGVVLVEPWFTPEAIQHGRVNLQTLEDAGLKMCRMSRMEVQGRLSRMHLEYLVGREEGIEHFSELHELGLFTVEEMLEAFRSAGLDALYGPEGPCRRGLYVARPQAAN